ncbi:uncharacterized protein RCC_05828 [Ramularia collo-cygni]|uniref:Uncharacterized protein n=1 Tax=Ramularia collo-cygni TaxID=112498 RepID=A0A2D3UTY0_9PEZI|nr:uncharacterized protein RCC_05828 [Ramularia collo-cygni]CZT19971.1 uncharacterized protein RCC_05828 [Ramularia collo-cygni]
METMTARTTYTGELPRAPSYPGELQPEARRTTTRVSEQPPSLSQPASQESFVSSNVSQATQATTHTELTSPSSLSRDDAAANASRALTPEEPSSAHANNHSALASPMSITSPVTVGTKRTANGHVKNAPSLGSNYPIDQRSRRESTASSGSRAGELAASLKERLGYAFLKVQHGWEHKSLNEVEHLAARARNNRASMTQVESRPNTSRLSNGAANLSMYDRIYNTGAQDVSAPPSKRHSGTYHMQYSQPQQPYQPSLQPALDIRPGSSQQSHIQFSSSQPGGYNSTAMSPPRTPSSDHPRRPPTIRTETQTKAAEQEALQALWQLGSPHNSQHPPQSSTSSQQASPLKTPMDLSATPRRVTFARSESNSSTASSGYIHDSRARALDDLENR